MPKSLKLELCPFIKNVARYIEYPEILKCYYGERIIDPTGGPNLWTVEHILPSIANVRCLANLDFCHTKVIGFYDFVNSQILNEPAFLKFFLKEILEHHTNGYYGLETIILFDEDMNEIMKIDFEQLMAHFEMMAVVDGFGNYFEKISYEEEMVRFFQTYVDKAKQKLEEGKSLKLIKNK